MLKIKQKYNKKITKETKNITEITVKKTHKITKLQKAQ